MCKMLPWKNGSPPLHSLWKMPCPLPEYAEVLVQKKYKSTHNSAIFWATNSRFYMEIYMDCQPNDKVLFVQKHKSTKNEKM